MDDEASDDLTGGIGTGGDRGRRATSRLPSRRWGRVAERWVPESLRQARVDPGRRGALALSVVAALAACVAALGVWLRAPEPTPVPPILESPGAASATNDVAGGSVVGNALSDTDPPSAASITPSADAGSTDQLAPTVIMVSVTGLVRHPGVVALPLGARVADAIAAAGGTRSTAELTGLNLAQRLADGDSVVIGSVDTGSTGPASPTAAAPRPSTPPLSAAPSMVNLNTASEAELEQLPGVGPVMAGNIIAWRDSNGPFTSVDQLREVGGIGEIRLAQLGPLVTL